MIVRKRDKYGRFIKDDSNKLIKICKYCDKEFKSKPAGNRKFCSRKCYRKYTCKENHPMWKGGQLTRNCMICGKEFKFDRGDIIREKGKNIRQFCSPKCHHIWMKGNKVFSGVNNPRWNGGVSPLIKQIRFLSEYKSWKNNIFKRDNWACQICNKSVKQNLNAHHIKSISQIIIDNNIKTKEDATICEELWNASNGITLCVKCHQWIHNLNPLNQQ